MKTNLAFLKQPIHCCGAVGEGEGVSACDCESGAEFEGNVGRGVVFDAGGEAELFGGRQAVEGMAGAGFVLVEVVNVKSEYPVQGEAVFEG